jgi:PAS domain S-box-containing protein
MNFYLTADILFSSAAILVGILLIARLQRVGPDRAATLALALCLMGAGVSRLLMTRLTDLRWLNTSEIVLAVASAYLPAIVFFIILGTLNLTKVSLLRNLLLFASAPLVVVLLASLAGGAKSTIPELGLITTEPNRWISIFSLGLLIATLSLVIVKASRSYKFIPGLPLSGMGISLFVAIILIGASLALPSAPIDFSFLVLAGFSVLGISLLFTPRRERPASLITHDELFESIGDGIILLSNEDVILDLNPAAERLLGIPGQRLVGNPVDLILSNWKSISGSSDAREVEFRGSILLNKQWRYISVRTNRLDNSRGRVILLRDITDRRDTHEARQHAREEMFNLLRSFFKTAHTSQSSNDFFRDVLFQVAYTFRADSGAICLVESPPEITRYKYSLMARHGSLFKDNASLALLYKALETSGWGYENQEALIIPDAAGNPAFASLASEREEVCIAILPLLHYEQMMGVLVLGRGAGNVFQSDEVVRLGVVTEELASFIYSDRKRKADIALAERHRLSQDLHDSITQKLVGLLQLTEAVKLGLESGAPVDRQRIDRISESARQALREMRLFLYELAPVDIERDGLITILQSRLASVEGRSDIQARMFTDNDILLSTQEETEIYYIVEEALNNILKHAGAKTVTIKLKQRKESIYLEIVDNGCGFDPASVKEGGRGLGNIHERAKRINGKLKITSSPGNGTKITLSIPKK